MYAEKKRATKQVKQKLMELEREIDKSIIVIWDLNKPNSIKKTTGPKGSKVTKELNYIINQHDLIDISKTLHSAAKHAFFSSSNITDYIMSYKIHHSKFKRIEIIQQTLLNHNKDNRKLSKHLETRKLSKL